jgi:hypothetical protein
VELIEMKVFERYRRDMEAARKAAGGRLASQGRVQEEG